MHYVVNPFLLKKAICDFLHKNILTNTSLLSTKSDEENQAS